MMHTNISGDATPEWTPSTRAPTKDSTRLNELGNNLQVMLAVMNEVLAVTHCKFLMIEDTFASASDAVQSMSHNWLMLIVHFAK